MMPTRRAFRPDSQHYRTFRRQGLLSRGSRSRAVSWPALVFFGAIAAGAVYLKRHGHGGFWINLVGWAAVAGFVLCLAGIWLTRRRG